MRQLNTKATVLDLLLTAVTIGISFWFILGFARASSDRQKYLLIYQNGQLIQKAEMNQDKIISLNVALGRLAIEINAEHGARIVESNCPAKVCVHAGWIKQPGETVVCLPNKILLEIKGEKEAYNAVSY